MRPDEAEVVGSLTLAAYDAAGERIEGDYRHCLADPLTRQGRATALLVAVDGDQVVGTVTFVTAGDPAFEHSLRQADCGFRMLATAPAAWGRGVGGALVDACIDRARAQGCRRMMIFSMAWMDRAHRLYERRGFVRRPDLDVRFPSGVGYVFALDLVADAGRCFDPPGPVPARAPWFEDVRS